MIYEDQMVIASVEIERKKMTKHRMWPKKTNLDDVLDYCEKKTSVHKAPLIMNQVSDLIK